MKLRRARFVINWSSTEDTIEYGNALPTLTLSNMLDGDNVDYTVTYTKNGATITDISKVYAGVYTLKVSITSANYVLPENSELP